MRISDWSSDVCSSDLIDPLAGSYYVEALTDQVEAETWAYLSRIEDLGGALSGIEAGFQQREIQESAFKLQRQAETRDRIVVGVNQIGRASCGERVCQYVWTSGVAV